MWLRFLGPVETELRGFSLLNSQAKAGVLKGLPYTFGLGFCWGSTSGSCQTLSSWSQNVSGWAARVKGKPSGPEPIWKSLKEWGRGSTFLWQSHLYSLQILLDSLN